MPKNYCDVMLFGGLKDGQRVRTTTPTFYVNEVPISLVQMIVPTEDVLYPPTFRTVEYRVHTIQIFRDVLGPIDVMLATTSEVTPEESYERLLDHYFSHVRSNLFGAVVGWMIFDLAQRSQRKQAQQRK